MEIANNEDKMKINEDVGSFEIAKETGIKLLGFRLNKNQIIGLVIGLIIIILDFIFITGNLFYFILGIAFMISFFPFVLFIIIEGNRMLEKETMFLEFVRNLVENVKVGTPISRAILNIQNKDFGALNFHINKLANQISIGIPIKVAFDTFARDIGSKVISRAINIISESEKAGGQIEEILESIVVSISQIDRLKKERRAAIYSLVVQGYIIFFIFIIIILVMEFKILPIAAGLSESFAEVSREEITGFGGVFGVTGEKVTAEELSRPFFWFLIIQGFFTGLVIGQLSEGEIKPGLKHSFILIVLAVLINTGTKLFLGSPIPTG